MLVWSALTFLAISPTPGDSPSLREALVLDHMQQGDLGRGGRQSLAVACLDELLHPPCLLAIFQVPQQVSRKGHVHTLCPTPCVPLPGTSFLPCILP